jgi:hypothetical protein
MSEASAASAAAQPPIKMCIDRILPPELTDQAELAAIMENPANLPSPQEADQPPQARSIALLKKKLWQPGRTLHVRFLDGDPQVTAKVAAVAQEWLQYANLQFVFDDAPGAEIRISFKQPGSWSYMGTDALLIPPDQPTMNYGWLTPATGDEEYSRVVLHEFGHAIGCIHEHQNPLQGIPWNEPAVMRFYQGPPNYWSEAQVRENLLKKYDRTEINGTDFDKYSIMLYPVQKELTIGGFEVPWSNSTLSAIDKAFIAQVYPKS